MRRALVAGMLCFAIATALPLSTKASLSSAQVTAILTLLQSFGASNFIVQNVKDALSGQRQSCTSVTIVRHLGLGSRGEDVSSLQQFLKMEGFYSYAQITGYFGPVTAASLAAFQKSQGLEAVGSVGPLTRAKIQAASLRCITEGSETSKPASPPAHSIIQNFAPGGGGGGGAGSVVSQSSASNTSTNTSSSNTSSTNTSPSTSSTSSGGGSTTTTSGESTQTGTGSTSSATSTETQTTENPSTSESTTTTATSTQSSAQSTSEPTVTSSPDLIPPSVTIVAPLETLPAGSATTTLEVLTNEPATCAYANNASTTFSGMTTFTSTGSTTHETTLSNLTDASSYTYYIQCKDVAGNISGSASITFFVAAPPDTQAPTAPTGFGATIISESQVALAWQPSSDNIGVAQYEVFRNGVQIAVTTASAYEDSGLATSTRYSYYVKALDAAGNVSSASATVSVTTPAFEGGTPLPCDTAPDGCVGSPVGTPQEPLLFSRYTTRPPWKVAGVDYYVGLPQSTVLLDPTVKANLPSCATASDYAQLGAHVIRVTAGNCVLSGFDFSLHGGLGVLIPSGITGNVSVINDNFEETSVSAAPLDDEAGPSASVFFEYNTVEGNGANGNSSLGALVFGSNLTVEYNWLKNAAVPFVVSGCTAGASCSVTYKYNLLEDGAQSPQARLGLLTWQSGSASNISLLYNTAIQHIEVGGGEGVTLSSPTGSITGADVGFNTIAALPTNETASPRQSGAVYTLGDAIVVPGAAYPYYFVTTPGTSALSTPSAYASTASVVKDGTAVFNAASQAMSYLMRAGSDAQDPGPFTGQIHDNYLDAGSAYAAFYPSLAGFTYCNNTDLLTGLLSSTCSQSTGSTSTSTATSTSSGSTATSSVFAAGTRITMTDRVNVRSTACNTGQPGKQNAGAMGTVTAGPQSGCGYTWIRVDFDSGSDGWVVADYATPVASTTSSGTSGGPTAFGIGVGVKTTDALNVRSQPSNSAKTILCTQAPGSLGVIVGGPQSQGNHTWWKIDYLSGCDGWSAQEYLTIGNF